VNDVTITNEEETTKTIKYATELSIYSGWRNSYSTIDVVECKKLNQASCTCGTITCADLEIAVSPRTSDKVTIDEVRLWPNNRGTSGWLKPDVYIDWRPKTSISYDSTYSVFGIVDIILGDGYELLSEFTPWSDSKFYVYGTLLGSYVLDTTNKKVTINAAEKIKGNNNY
jgi:hypothetical protein